MRKNKKIDSFILAGGMIIVILMLLSLIGFFYTPYEPNKMDAASKFLAPSLKHFMGTDHFGRDIFSRVMKGLGTTATVGLSIVVISGTAGAILGLLTGYFGGIADEIIMRICDMINGFPSILLALVFISVLGSGITNVILALGIIYIPSFTRIVRSETIKYRNYDFVKSARLMGVGSIRIMFVHIFPNIFSTFLASVTVGINNAILAEAGMSYLGIGVNPPAASLGSMLSDAQAYLQSAPWYALGPGLTIILMILGFSLLSEGIRRSSC